MSSDVDLQCAFFQQAWNAAQGGEKDGHSVDVVDVDKPLFIETPCRAPFPNFRYDDFALLINRYMYSVLDKQGFEQAFGASIRSGAEHTRHIVSDASLKRLEPLKEPFVQFQASFEFYQPRGSDGIDPLGSDFAGRMYPYQYPAQESSDIGRDRVDGSSSKVVSATVSAAPIAKDNEPKEKEKVDSGIGSGTVGTNTSVESDVHVVGVEAEGSRPLRPKPAFYDDRENRDGAIKQQKRTKMRCSVL